MADALCGPSNPLASFQKHTQADRTLQQERLTGPRHSPAQGFRSQDFRAGHLDAEFAAFEASQPNAFQFQQAFHPPPFHGPQAPISNWAADFQKLHVSEQPIPAHQFRTEAPLVRNGLGGWQNEFLKQRPIDISPVSVGKQPERAVQTSTMGWHAQQSGYLDQPMWPQTYQPAQMPFQEPVHDGTHQYTDESHMQTSDADFEAAFSEAQKEIQERDSLSHRSFDLMQEGEIQENRDYMEIEQDALDRMAEEQAHKFFAEHGLLHTDDPDQSMNTNRPGLSDMTQRIGADAINYTEQKDRTADQDSRDADELARTAGQLLHSVQSDSSDKFKESRFLDLMRRIRDREVEVQGEDFVETANPSIETNLDHIHNIANERPIPTNNVTGATYNAQPDQFTFPDLNEVYDPDPATGRPRVNYHFDTHDNHTTSSMQKPRSQIQELHPGGRYYPEQSPPPQANYSMMSGGLSSTSTAYHPPTVEDAATSS